MSLSAAGDTNWTYCYDGGQSYDAAFSLVYGLDNNVYAAGYSTGGSGDWYFTVISLGCIGSENWTYTYSGDLYEWNGARAITYGADSNIYVAGRCSWASSGNDFVVLSLNAAGDTNWTYRLQGSMDFDDDAEAIVYGSDGNIYAAGTIVDAMSARDFAVVSLDENGTENWVYTYTAAPTYWWDEAYAITYGLDDKVYAAGYSIDSTSISLWDFTVISLDPVTGIEETKTIPEQVVRLEAIPNPFTYTTDIRCQITDNRQECELKIYDIAGCLVADLSRRLSGVGYPSSVRWDGTDDAGNRLPGGIYFVRAVSNDYCTVERLILIR
jgi:hypothetical protein